MSLHASIIKNLQTDALSLADLQSITQVSLPTLRKAVQELTESQWIRVVGQSEANGGRPPMLFGLDESFYMLVGVHLQLPGMRLITTDLSGKVLDEIESFETIQPSPEQVIEAITAYVHDVGIKFSERSMLGIGIATPGFIAPKSGDIISIGRVKEWRTFPICQRLESSLSVPVFIANDVDCMAFAEFHHARRSPSNNLVYVGFDEGVKVSLFLKGEIYKGSFGNAGLIVNRFLKVADDTISDEDQKRILSISGMNQIFQERVGGLPETERAPYESMLATSPRDLMEAIFLCSQEGHEICQHVTNILKVVLATAIANIIYVVQPDVVVIGGLLSTMPRDLFADLTTAIREHLPSLFSNHIHIEQAQLSSSNVAALGAVYHFMDEYLIAPFQLVLA